MTKHTQGPWFIDSQTQDDRVLIRKLDSDKGLSSHIAVCFRQTLCAEHGGGIEANARLIAAAPDLLEALESARSFVQSQCDLHDAGDLSRGDFALLEEIENAINKAKGE